MPPDPASFHVIASASCRICGDVYGLLLPHGAASAAVRAMDNGTCAKCHAEDNPDCQGVLSCQVCDDFEGMEWAQGWEEQAQAAYDKKRALNAGRYPESVTDARTCPACGREFEVELHARPGRVRDYCCEACGAQDRLRRWRAKSRQ